MEEIEQEQEALDSRSPDPATPERAHSGPLASSLSSFASRPVISGLLDRMRSLRWSDTPPGSPQIPSSSSPTRFAQQTVQPLQAEQPDVPGLPSAARFAQQSRPEQQSDAAAAEQTQEIMEAEHELEQLARAEEEAAGAEPASGSPSRGVKAQKAKLGQLQKLAKFAQSARGGVRSRVWPTFQHFGRCGWIHPEASLLRAFALSGLLHLAAPAEQTA